MTSKHERSTKKSPQKPKSTVEELSEMDFDFSLDDLDFDVDLLDINFDIDFDVELWGNSEKIDNLSQEEAKKN